MTGTWVEFAKPVSPPVPVKLGELAHPETYREGGGAASTQPWYVVHSKPCQEQLAAENLLRQGYAVYLPRLKLFKRIRGKQQIQFEPLFPRYLFVQPQSSAQSIAPVRSTLGVASLVRFGVQPAQMAAATLADIQALEANNHASSADDISPFQPGQSIRIIEGPLGGLEGLVSAVKQQRVLVLLHLLGQETRVSLSHHQLAVAH